jgi:hypothetical protein
MLDRVNAEPGGIYGRFTDRALYAALMDGDLAPFVGLAEELAEAFARDHGDYVVGDAAEGYNPAHDACRGAGARSWAAPAIGAIGATA